MKVINNKPSPFGRKVMIALKEKDIPFEIQWDIPWHKDTSVVNYNPLEQLPILITSSNEVIYESNYILEWLERRYPIPRLTPESDDELLSMKLLQVLGVGVMDAIVKLAFEHARPGNCQSAEWKQRQTRKIDRGLKEISRLIGHKEYAVANMLTHADIEIGVLLGHLDFLTAENEELAETFREVQWPDWYSNLTNYLEQLEKRPSFLDARPEMVEMDLQSTVRSTLS